MVISAETVMAARDDAQPTGEAYCELAMTGAIVAGVPPLWRREVASFLRGILRRPPVAVAPAYEPHRAILGSLLLELETFAIRDAGGEGEPSAADLRDPAIVAREREAVRGFQAWAASEQVRQAAAYHAHVDEVIAESAAAHEEADRDLAAATERVQAAVSAPAPVQPAEEAADAIPSWL